MKADIAAHGLREPAWTAHGHLIDGRHRRRACHELGIDCPTREYAGTPEELTAFVVSLNLHRRHLNESQRAMIAAELATASHGGERRKVQDADLPLERPVTRSEAAKLLNIGARTVGDAAKVRKQGSPELIGDVKAGRKSINAAKKGLSTKASADGDSTEATITDHLVPVLAVAPLLKELRRLCGSLGAAMTAAAGQITELADLPAELDAIAVWSAQFVAESVCEGCQGDDLKCKGCKGRGFVPLCEAEGRTADDPDATARRLNRICTDLDSLKRQV